MWVWVTVGVGTFGVLSLLVGLVVTRVLGTIAREVSELFETEVWLNWPTRREAEEHESVTTSQRDNERLQAIGGAWSGPGH